MRYNIKIDKMTGMYLVIITRWTYVKVCHMQYYFLHGYKFNSIQFIPFQKSILLVQCLDVEVNN